MIEEVIDHEQDEAWMLHAQHLADRAKAEGEVPVGAVLVQDNKIIGEGWNQSITHHDPSAHAEIMALRNAGRTLENYRLPKTTLYVTLEPCAMCAGGIIHCRIRSVIFGCSSPKDGAAGGGYVNLLNQPTLNHRSEIRSGVLADYSSQLLRDFFQSARSNSKKKN